MKGYSYFVSYWNSEGVGNCTLTLESEIADWGDISTIEEAIEEERSEDEVRIINWILLVKVSS